jgi:hypothetical protein
VVSWRSKRFHSDWSRRYCFTGLAGNSTVFLFPPSVTRVPRSHSPFASTTSPWTPPPSLEATFFTLCVFPKVFSAVRNCNTLIRCGYCTGLLVCEVRSHYNPYQIPLIYNPKPYTKIRIISHPSHSFHCAGCSRLSPRCPACNDLLSKRRGGHVTCVADMWLRFPASWVLFTPALGSVMRW